VNPGDFTLRDCCDFTKILLNEILTERNSLLLLAVFEVLHIQGGVTNILTVGRSATAVKVKVNSQNIQNLFGQMSDKNFSGQNTLQSLKPTIKHNTF